MSKPSNPLSEGISNRAGIDNDTRLPQMPVMSANSLFAMAQFRMNELPGSYSFPRTNRSPCAGIDNAPSRRLQLVAILDEAIRIGDDFLAENDEAPLATGTAAVSGSVPGAHYERSRQ